MLVQMLDEERRTKGRLVVNPGAAVAVTTATNLEVEGTVHLVLLGAVNLRQMLRHVGYCGGRAGSKVGADRESGSVCVREREPDSVCVDLRLGRRGRTGGEKNVVE